MKNQKILILTAVLAGLISYLYLTNKDSPAVIYEDPISDESGSMQEKDISDTILDLLVAKYGWNKEEMTVGVSHNDGTYATGSVGDKYQRAGGGMWFASKSSGDWEIVWDGNGSIFCSNLVGHEDFPTDLIPQCYDDENMVLVTR